MKHAAAHAQQTQPSNRWRPGSLCFRLLAATAVALGVALVLAALLLAGLLREQVA